MFRTPCNMSASSMSFSQLLTSVPFSYFKTTRIGNVRAAVYASVILLAAMLADSSREYSDCGPCPDRDQHRIPAPGGHNNLSPTRDRRKHNVTCGWQQGGPKNEAIISWDKNRFQTESLISWQGDMQPSCACVALTCSAA